MKIKLKKDLDVVYDDLYLRKINAEKIVKNIDNQVSKFINKEHLLKHDVIITISVEKI